MTHHQTKVIPHMKVQHRTASFLTQLRPHRTRGLLLSLWIKVSFKHNTGAEVTAITEKSLELLGLPSLICPIRNLCGPNCKPLPVRSSLSVNLHHGQHFCTHEIFVAKHLSQNFMGLPAIKNLHQLAIVNNIQTDLAISIQNQFPSLSTGIGTLQGEYLIH